jgi:hypothetical protein
MSLLTDRLREVTVTLDSPSPLPANLPQAWLQPQAVDCIVSFVHSNYQGSAVERNLPE